MRTNVPSRRRTAVLYGATAVVLVLGVATARSIWTAWQRETGEARAEAVFELVEQRTPMRPTDAPGAMAWLRQQLVEYSRYIGHPVHAREYHDFAAPADGVPPELATEADALQTSAASKTAAPVTLRFDDWPDATPDSERRERLVEFNGHQFAVTRRRAIDDDIKAATPSNLFLSRAAAAIDDTITAMKRRALPGPTETVPSADGLPPRPVRVYAISEDGTLISAPWPAAAGEGSAVARELSLLSARPELPSFAPQEFFFRPSSPSARSVAAYSGFYLDLGGRGLVSTITMPLSGAA